MEFQGWSYVGFHFSWHKRPHILKLENVSKVRVLYCNKQISPLRGIHGVNVVRHMQHRSNACSLGSLAGISRIVPFEKPIVSQGCATGKMVLLPLMIHMVIPEINDRWRLSTVG